MSAPQLTQAEVDELNANLQVLDEQFLGKHQDVPMASLTLEKIQDDLKLKYPGYHIDWKTIQLVPDAQ